MPKLLAGFEDKTGYAMTIFAYLESEHAKPILFVGKTHGTIIQPRGVARFGWDANFLENSTQMTYAEMTPEQKHAVSQRGKAGRDLVAYFRNKLGGLPVGHE